MIERWPDWPDRVVALVGPEGSGKSHLAAIWAEKAGARVLSAESARRDRLPAALATGALVRRGSDADELDERALFHLLNLAREEGAFVLITARVSRRQASRSASAILRSRLRAVPVVTLAPPDDALLRALMVKLAADRQLVAGRAWSTIFANRIERSFAAARAAVASARSGGDAAAPAGDAGAGGGTVSHSLA